MQKKEKEKKDKNNLILFFLTFVLFLISVILFCFAFYYEQKIKIYFLTALVFTLFCISYYICNKKITCKDGYNMIQAYFFYKKYEKVYGKDLSNKERSKAIYELAQENDSFENLDENQTMNLYMVGKYVSKLLKK